MIYKARLSLLVIVALVFAACSGNGATGGDSESVETTAASETPSTEVSDSTVADGDSTGGGGSGDPVTLFLPTGAFERTMLPILDDFVAETGIPVEPIAQPAADARSRQVLDLDAGTGDIDLILLDGRPWVAEVAHHLQPLNDLLEEDNVDTSSFFPALVDIFAMDGNQYAFPLGMNTRSLIYRADLFEEAGFEPPETWDEFREIAEYFTDGDMYGFAGPWGRTTSYVSSWLLISGTFGLEKAIDDEARTAHFNSEEGIAAGQFMADLYIDGLMPPDAIEFDHDATLGAMRQGRAAMTILPNTFIAELNDPEASEHAGNFMYALAPTASPDIEDRYVVTGWGYGLSPYTDNTENAWELLKYLIDRFQYPTENAAPEQLARPGSEAAFEHPGVQEVFFGGQADLVKESLSRATPPPGIAEWVDIESLIGDVLQRAFLGETTVADGFAEIEPQVKALLGG